MMAELWPVPQLVAIITAIFSIMVLGAVIVHPIRKELMALGEEIRAYEGLNKYERDGINMMLATSTSFFTGFLMLLGPLIVLIQYLAGAPEMSPVMRRVPKQKMARLNKLTCISVFAANPFAGLLWVPLHAMIIAVLLMTHSSLAISPFGGFYRAKSGAHIPF